MTELSNWIVGETADHGRYCLIHIGRPACFMWLSDLDEDGVPTDDIDVDIQDFHWLGEPKDEATMMAMIAEGVAVMAIYDNVDEEEIDDDL